MKIFKLYTTLLIVALFLGSSMYTFLPTKIDARGLPPVEDPCPTFNLIDVVNQCRDIPNDIWCKYYSMRLYQVYYYDLGNETCYAGCEVFLGCVPPDYPCPSPPMCLP